MFQIILFNNHESTLVAPFQVYLDPQLPMWLEVDLKLNPPLATDKKSPKPRQK